MLQDLLLVCAGFAGGIVNTLAGGGSFITFPALLVAGVPPVSASATNTFAALAGYLSGTYGLRRQLAELRDELPVMLAASIMGGTLGALLLLRTTDRHFATAVPWLLLLATLLYAFGGRIGAELRIATSNRVHAGRAGRLALALMLYAVCVYGGYFNAGLGILVLAWLALAGHSHINVMNAAKLLVSSGVSLVAVVVFAALGAIAWHAGLLVLLGSLVGGYAAARLALRLPQSLLNRIVLAAASLVTALFFLRVYATG